MKIPKIFQLIKLYQSELILSAAIVLITITSFNLGKITAYQSLKTPVTITQPDNSKQVTADSKVPAVSQKPVKDPTVVASKKSKSKLYHFTWCPGVAKIAAANKITFPTEAAALAAGYTLAGNCKK